MKKKCIINNCSEEGRNKQHVFSGQIKVRTSLKPDFPYICPKHEHELNKAMRDIKKDEKIPLNSPWIELGTVGDTTVWGRKKKLDLSAGTFCSIDDNLWELSVEKSKDVYVDQMKDWYLFKSEDKVRRIAYALRLETGTTY